VNAGLHQNTHHGRNAAKSRKSNCDCQNLSHPFDNHGRGPVLARKQRVDTSLSRSPSKAPSRTLHFRMLCSGLARADVALQQPNRRNLDVLVAPAC
jgi:hypothetical protein